MDANKQVPIFKPIAEMGFPVKAVRKVSMTSVVDPRVIEAVRRYSERCLVEKGEKFNMSRYIEECLRKLLVKAGEKIEPADIETWGAVCYDGYNFREVKWYELRDMLQRGVITMNADGRVEPVIGEDETAVTPPAASDDISTTMEEGQTVVNG